LKEAREKLVEIMNWRDQNQNLDEEIIAAVDDALEYGNCTE